MNEQNPYLSVVIPAYKEEGTVEKTLRRFDEYLKSKDFSYEILVVIDGHGDKTNEEVIGMKDEIAHLRWVDREENKGKGYTVREGMREAKGEIRLFTDMDNATDIAHFDKMIPLFKEGKDVVICSRESWDAKGAQQAKAQPFHKRFLGNLGNLYIQALVIPGIWDTQCGFKAFTGRSAEAIFPLTRIDRWALDTEILGLARKFGFSIGIVPAHWIDDETTTVGAGGYGYVHTLLEVTKVGWWLFINSYGIKKKK